MNLKTNLKILKKFSPALWGSNNTIDYSTMNVVCVGDSLTYGAGSSTGNTYPQQLAALNTFATVSNQGISGVSVTQLFSTAAVVDAIYNANKLNVCVVWCGTNDLYLNLASGIGATTFAALSTYCQARRAAGFKVIVVDMIARNVSTNQSLFNTERASFNSLLANGYKSFADAFVSLSSQATLSDYSNTTYFQNDGVHLKDAGYAIVAAAVLRGILNLSFTLTRTISLSGNLSFGTVTIGQTSTATLAISNTGNAALSVSAITLPSGFTASWTSGTIAGGATQNVTITFSPTLAQSYGGTVRISSNANSGTSTTNASGTGSSAPTYDSASTTFFNAVSTAGVTLTSGQMSAVDTLITALKSASIWSSLSAVYPMIGGTAAAHAINAKSPGTYNISWSGTVTHSANGVLGDQSTGFGNTGLVPSTVFGGSNNAVSMGFYSRTQDHSGALQVDMGALNSYTQALALGEDIDNSNGKIFYVYGSSFATSADSTRTTTGFLVGTKPDSNTYLYKNGSLLATYTGAQSTSAPTLPVYILAWNNNGGGAQYFTKRQIAFAFVGAALPQSSMSAFYSAVQAYQISLGRNV